MNYSTVEDRAVSIKKLSYGFKALEKSSSNRKWQSFLNFLNQIASTASSSSLDIRISICNLLRSNSVIMKLK